MTRGTTRAVAAVFVAAVFIGCTPASPPLLQAPGAKIVLVGADAGVGVAVVDLLVRSGVLDKADGLGLQVDAQRKNLVGRPVVASLLESGAVVIATRIPRGAGLFSEGDVVVGKVRRAPSVHPDALVRIDGDRALVGLPFGTDTTSLAGLLEALAASDPPPAAPALVADGALHLHITALGKQPIDPPLHLAIRAVGNEIALDEPLPAPARPALAAAAPGWACAFDDAAALLAIPPFDALASSGVGADSFAGSVILAVYPPSLTEPPTADDPLSYLSLLATGVPRDAAAAEELFAAATLVAGKDAVVATDGARRTLTLDGRRKLRIVSEPGLFALALGGAAPIERARKDAPCQGRETPLFSAAGDKLARIVLPALVTPDVIAKTLGGMSVDDALPLARLRGISRIRVDSKPGISARITLVVPE